MDYTTGEASRVRSVPLRGLDKEWASPACGLAVNDDGERLAVFAGGQKTINSIETDEVLIYNVEQDLWLDGPSLPYEEGDAKAVQYQDSFLFIGKEAILKYNPSGSGSWDGIGFEYADGLGYFEVETATLVPRSYVDCQDQY